MVNRRESPSHWVNMYINHGIVSTWDLPKNLEDSPEVELRNLQAEEMFKVYDAPTIVRKTCYYSYDEMEGIYTEILENIIKTPLSGLGIELGSGCSLFSTTIASANREHIDHIFSLEICLKYSQLIAPKVSKHKLSQDYNMVVPICGDYNNLFLDDNSLDFACEIDSYHHSHNLEMSFNEISRVLKPSGLLLCIDRVHPNELSDIEIAEMLDIKYEQKFLENHKYPDNIILTRRENGEHEFRYYEWEAAYKKAGFELIDMVKFYNPSHYKNKYYILFKLIPKSLRYFVTNKRIKNQFYLTHESLLTYVRLLLSRFFPFSFKNRYFRYIPSKYREKRTVFLLRKIL